MEPSVNPEVQELPVGVPRYRRKVESFLESNSLRLEDVDLYLAILDGDGEILAGGGLKGDVIKCVAVGAEARSQGLAAPLVSRLVALAFERGVTSLKVFTKPENVSIFQSLGFSLLAQAPKAVLMENGRGLEEYCAYLRSLRQTGRCGVIVMNANPFTLGHRYLVQKALEQVQHVFIIPVREENHFPYSERLEMIRAGVASFGKRVTVADGSAYCISAATFPTYFLKELSDAAETQMRLDVNLFQTHISPALGSPVRFVGSEPSDPLTARYNAILQELMPGGVVEIPRLEAISASVVRRSAFIPASELTPASTHPFLLSSLACEALRAEAGAPMKPGLVGPDSPGAHKDMSYPMMLSSITAIRPFFPRMARAASAEELRQAGIDAEEAMLAATGGVNTHRGAIFAVGLMLAAAGPAAMREPEPADYQSFISSRLPRIAQSILANKLAGSELHLTHGEEAVDKYKVKGAMQMALDGYKELFGDWLPYYRSVKGSEYALQRTLLHIMSTLDDTCIIHRAGFNRAQQVKREAAGLLGIAGQAEEIAGQAGNDDKRAGNDVFVTKLREMCERYAAEGISPGGCADMLSLTLFADSILPNNNNN